MTKKEALELIDNHKNKLIDPVEMLHWTHLRVTILTIPEWQWDAYVETANKTLSR